MEHLDGCFWDGIFFALLLNFSKYNANKQMFIKFIEDHASAASGMWSNPSFEDTCLTVFFPMFTFDRFCDVFMGIKREHWEEKG